MNRLSVDLHIIAILNLLARLNVSLVSEDKLVELVEEGAIHAMKQDPDWRVCDSVCKHQIDPKKIEFEPVPETTPRRLGVLAGAGVVTMVRDRTGETFYRLSDLSRSELRKAADRRSAGLDEPIVHVACRPAHNWARHHKKDHVEV